MERHLLVTVSEHQSARNGVRYVGRFFSNKKDLKVTLFYTAPRPAALWEGEKTRESLAHTEMMAKQYEDKGRKALDAARRELNLAGFFQEQIQVRLQTRRFRKIMDIIQEGEAGLYDAVVLGRRGLSRLEEAFDESVSKGLFEQPVSFPIWCCRNPDLDRRNVLLCLDGSESAYRMADHVEFILSVEAGHEVTLLCVMGKSVKKQKEAEDILAKGKAMVIKNGFSENRVKSRILESGKVAKTILSEAKTGRFAAVAMGRTGRGHGFVKNFFMGSVSTSLFREMERSALWFCH